jgi:hypothetical protein
LRFRRRRRNRDGLDRLRQVGAEEEHPELVVRELTGVADDEVGRDLAGRARELPLAADDVDRGAAVAEMSVRRADESTVVHRPAPEHVPVAEVDREDRRERPAVVEYHARLEKRLLVAVSEEEPRRNPVVLESRLAGAGGGARPQEKPVAVVGYLTAELEREGEQPGHGSIVPVAALRPLPGKP